MLHEFSGEACSAMPPEQDKQEPNPQALEFIQFVYDSDPRIDACGWKDVELIAERTVSFARSAAIGSRAARRDTARTSIRFLAKFVRGEPIEEIADTERVAVQEATRMLGDAARRVHSQRLRKIKLGGAGLDDELQDFFTENFVAPESGNLWQATEFEPSEALAAFRRKDIAGAAGSRIVRSVTAEHGSRPLQEPQVIAVPEFWKKPRPGQMETSELKIADNDTILHPDFPRQTLVFSETEIRIFNMLLVSQTRPASTSALLDEFRSSSSRRFIRGPHDVKILKELEELGVITRPQDSSDGTNIGFAQWTLNPNFVIRDIRSELAEAENAEKYHDVEHVIHDVQKKLVADGWAYVTDRMLGFGPELIKEFSGIFASNIMREVPNDRPVGRKRARDVLDFFHLGNAGRIFDDTSEIDTKFSRDPVYLSAAPSNAVINRVANNIDETSRPKEYPRFNVMAYPVIKRFVGMLPRLVPPELRATKGRVCLDAFSVKERPVDGQHKDGVDVVFVRVNRKVGDGARTRLHGRLRDLKPHDSTRPRVSKKIPEGGMLIFLDSRFTHDATPVIPDHLGNSLRETTIGTITYER